MSLLIKNAMIVNPDKAGKNSQDILIEKGLIKKIESSIKDSAAQTIDAKGFLVMPGLIDMHVHFREPGQEHKETIESGSKAAAKGGFTTVMCMPNTSPVIDNKSIVESIIKEAKRVGLVNVIPVGAITKGLKGEELTEMFELKASGCLALSDDGRCVTNSRLMRLAFEYAKMVDILLIQHCEDHCMTHQAVMNEGLNSTILGLRGWPAAAESIIVGRDIELAQYLGGRIHFAHISSARSVELIRQAKAQGLLVTAEACPHHFSLTDDELKSFNSNAKVNPPLRAKEDVKAIKEAIKEGIIDCIATDHAPHTREDKELGLDHAPCGMIGLETAVGLTISELAKSKMLSWSQMVERMSSAPAKILGLKLKGEIKEGFDADIVIIDPNKEWIVSENDFVSKSINSPFVGRRLNGKVETTICNGKVVYQA